MPFGTRKRLRQSFRMIDPVLPIRKNEDMKVKEISNQGLENTSQREEARPSAKAPIQFTLDRDTGKGVNRPTPIVNKADPSVGNPDAPHPTAQDKAAIGDVSVPSKTKSAPPKASPKPQSKPQAKVLQIITDKVKANIKKSENKIAKGGMRSRVEKEIRVREVQLKKLRTLLAKCPTCK